MGVEIENKDVAQQEVEVEKVEMRKREEPEEVVECTIVDGPALKVEVNEKKLKNVSVFVEIKG